MLLLSLICLGPSPSSIESSSSSKSSSSKSSSSKSSSLKSSDSIAPSLSDSNASDESSVSSSSYPSSDSSTTSNKTSASTTRDKSATTPMDIVVLDKAASLQDASNASLLLDNEDVSNASLLLDNEDVSNASLLLDNEDSSASMIFIDPNDKVTYKEGTAIDFDDCETVQGGDSALNETMEVIERAGRVEREFSQVACEGHLLLDNTSEEGHLLVNDESEEGPDEQLLLADALREEGGEEEEEAGHLAALLDHPTSNRNHLPALDTTALVDPEAPVRPLSLSEQVSVGLQNVSDHIIEGAQNALTGAFQFIDGKRRSNRKSRRSLKLKE